MFPQIHAATGRDTTPFLHVIDKIKNRKSEASKHNWCFMQSFRHHG